MKPSVHKCEILQLPKVHNEAGNLTALEYDKDIPFSIKRVYYLYDVPGGAERGGHGHKNLHQFIISLSGSFDILIDDGVEKKMVHLDRPYIGLHIIPGIWRELINFSSGAICLVLASEKYTESDYLRDYETFKQYLRNGNI